MKLGTYGMIRRIVRQRIKSNKIRSVFIGIIILFAAGILTFVASYAFNISHKYATETGYQAIYLNLSEDNILKLKQDSRISNIGFYQSVGMTEKENGMSMALVSADANTMKLSNVSLKEGSMPETENEILIEQGYLDKKQPNAKIGDSISLTYRNQANRQIEKYSFVIKGIISTTAENDENRFAYNSIVSSKFVENNDALSRQPISAMIAVQDAQTYSNQALKQLVQDIGIECGVAADQIQVNNLYIDSNNISGDTILTVLAIVIVLLSICALIIYNIFYISIVGNVKFFGQLRTIGATKKQIKKIVAIESNRIASGFVPIGCLLGYMLVFLADRQTFQAVMDIVIAIFSGVLVFLIVKLSVRKPAKIAMNISPIEASKYSVYSGRKKGIMRQHILTPFVLAVLNLRRNKRKSTLTFISLVLSGMLLISMSSVLTSLNPIERAKQSFPYDASYKVELNRSIISPTVSFTDLQEKNPLTNTLYQKLVNLEGIEKVISQKEISAVLDGTETVIYGMNEYDYKDLSSCLVAGNLPDTKEGDKGLIVNIGSPELEYLNKTYNVGDKISFSLEGTEGKKSVTFEVSAVISDKNKLTTFILPNRVIDKLVPYNTNSAYVLIASEEYSQVVEDAIQSIILEEDTLCLETLNDLVIQYKSVFSTISIAAYTFLGFIVAFSVINFMNTCMTNVISRKREVGLLRAVGLDHGQLCKMISTENLFLTLGSFFISVTFGTIIGEIICSFVKNLPGFSFVHYTIPLWSIVAYMLAIIALQFGITEWAKWYYGKSSVTEQIRVID